MFNFLKKLISTPAFSDDEKTRRAEFLHRGSSILFVFTLILFWINLEYGSQAAKDANWLLKLIALVQIIILLMIRLGYVDSASILLLTIGWAVMTVTCWKVGGINDEAVFGYVLILIASSYLLGWRITFVYTLASIAALWWLASLQMSRSFVPNIDDPFQTALNLTVIFVLILLVLYFLIKTLAKALKDAKRELSERIRIESEREKLISELQTALAEVKTLQGIIPICTSWKKIKDDEGYWQQVEKYIQDRSEAAFSHGICHECAKKLYPEFDLDD